MDRFVKIFLNFHSDVSVLTVIIGGSNKKSILNIILQVGICLHTVPDYYEVVSKWNYPMTETSDVM